MSQSIHPEHCRCSRCMPRGPRRHRVAHTLTTLALAMAAAAGAVLASTVSDHVRDLLVTHETF